MHQQVGALVRRGLEGGNLSGGLARRLTEMLDELSAIYQRHMAAEDNEVFPLAASLLEKSEIEAIGREMAAGRGIDLVALARKLEG